MSKIVNIEYKNFFIEIKERIRQAQYDALKIVNKQLILLYWDIGKLIVDRQETLGWGKSIVENLSSDLRKEFPGIKGFSVQNLWYMRQFFSIYYNDSKLQPLVGEISWAKHLVVLSRCKDNLERAFYIKMTKKFGWSKNVLIHQIENKSYQKYLLIKPILKKPCQVNIKIKLSWLLKTNILSIF